MRGFCITVVVCFSSLLCFVFGAVVRPQRVRGFCIYKFNVAPITRCNLRLIINSLVEMKMCPVARKEFTLLLPQISRFSWLRATKLKTIWCFKQKQKKTSREHFYLSKVPPGCLHHRGSQHHSFMDIKAQITTQHNNIVESKINLWKSN